MLRFFVHLAFLCAAFADEGWLVKNYTFLRNGTTTFNGKMITAYKSQIQYALKQTYKDSDGEAVDAMEHYFYGQMNGIAMELGGLDGSRWTG